MNDIEKMLFEVEKKYQEEVRRQEEAANEKALADEMKAEAIKKEKAAKAALKDLEVARNHAQKAQESYNAFKNATSDKNDENEESANKLIIKEEVSEESNKKKKGFGSGLVIGAATVGLIATGAWALSRDSLTGDVRAASWFKRNDKNTSDELVPGAEAEIVQEDPGFVYDYENNVVVIKTQTDPNATYSYDFEANSATDTQYVDANGNPIPVVTEAGQTITNPIINDNLSTNGEYVVLTTEKFEDLTSNLIKKFESLGLKVAREKVIKYVMLRNIDKLRQDNVELIEEIVGSQDIFEVITDACEVLDAMRNYNLSYFDKYHNTEGFISATEGIFDESQKAIAQEVERRVYEIGAAYQDETKYNELTYTLIRDLYNPLNPISQLEDGVNYGMMSVDMYMVRSTFGTDRYIRLNDMNADLIQYIVSFPGDDDEHSDNALMNGNISNVIRLLSECNVKTRTK